MARFTITIFLLLSFAGEIFPNVIYVDHSQSGDGTSWANPFQDLRLALEIAQSGDEIWVASGTYKPIICSICSESDRAKSFVIPSGVKIYGGFSRGEVNREERNPLANQTTLSGNIGYADEFDNSFSVVYFENVKANTTIDGFTIFGGNANKKTLSDGEPGRSGGGVYNVSSNGLNSSPTISNCLFIENFAGEGAGIFNLGIAGTASVVVENCSFLKNKALNAGGAIMDFSFSGSETNSDFSDCKFVNNEAKFGGAYFCGGPVYEEQVFDSCFFIKNKSGAGGAAYFSFCAGKPNLIFSETCSFEENESKHGGDLYFQKKKNNSALVEKSSDISL